MKIWGLWRTEMSTTATTSTSPSPWLLSMQYVLIHISILLYCKIKMHFFSLYTLNQSDFVSLWQESIVELVCDRLSWSIHTTNLWPKRVFSWLFTFSFTPTCTPKRNSGKSAHWCSRQGQTCCCCSSQQLCFLCSGWTQRSGWPQWRCCYPRALMHVSGWCSTWSHQRDERSPGLWA